VADYIANHPMYDVLFFRHRFRMRKELFLLVVNFVTLFAPYFEHMASVVGEMGLSPLQKCTAAMRMLAYGGVANATDEYCCLTESTALEAMKRF
jgi:hypothetical protein